MGACSSGTQVYANEFMYDVKPSEEDMDGLEMESVVDEKVRCGFNSYPRCPSTLCTHIAFVFAVRSTGLRVLWY